MTDTGPGDIDWIREVVEGSGGIIYVVRTRPEVAVEYASPSVHELGGYSVDELVENPGLLTSIISTGDRASLADKLLLEPGMRSDIDLRWTHRDGKSVWLRHRTECLERPDGSVALRGVAFDVSDLHGVQERLRQSEARFQSLAENATDFVATFTPDGVIDWVSPNIEHCLGWTPEQVVGQDAARFLHPSLRAELPGWREAANAGSEVSGRSQLLCADGSYRWFARSLRALRDADGTVIGRIAGFQDITREVEAEQTLAQREREARDLAENSADLVVRTTADGIIDWVSPSVTRVLGWTPQEVVGRRSVDFLHPDFLPLAQDNAQRVNSGETARGRSQMRRKDGTYLWLSWHAKPVLDDTGNVVARISGWRDISAEVEYEQRLAESERRYRLLAENSSDVVFLGDTDAVLRWASPSIRDVHGWEVEDVVGQHVTSLIHPDDVEAMKVASQQANTGQRAEYQARWRCADGSYRWMAVILRPVTDSSGAVTGRVASARDIEAELQTRQRLASSEQRFRTALESAPAGMAVLSPDRMFLEVNPALCRLLGRDEQWLTSHGIADVLDPHEDRLDQQMRAEVLSTGHRSLTREHEMVRSDGQRVWVAHSIGVVRDSSGEATSFVSQFVDVTESRRARELLRFLASHDSLTELMNRREILARLEALLTGPSRIAVLFIDLDRLKSLNDRYGHVVCDEIIREVAARIRTSVLPPGLVGRYGGDEFIAVLPEVDHIDEAVALAEELHTAVREPITVQETRITVTLSIGVAMATSTDDPDRLLSRADAALYQAKSAGRNRTASARG